MSTRTADTQPEPIVLRDGRLFHLAVQREWKPVAGARAEIVVVDSAGRSRRIDILVRVDEEMVSVVEIKNTAWDRVADHRVKPNVLKHAQQIWTYVEPFLDVDGVAVCPAVIYRKRPEQHDRLELIEQLLNDRGIQVVWQDETPATRKARAEHGT